MKEVVAGGLSVILVVEFYFQRMSIITASNSLYSHNRRENTQMIKVKREGREVGVFVIYAAKPD